MDAIETTKTPKRLAVFIDASNLYRDFRRAFCQDPMLPTDGQFDPLKLGQLLATRAPLYEDWTLLSTRVYMGQASAARDSRMAAANDKQIATWRAMGVAVRPRLLRYPPSWPAVPAQQKGVDVELAVDVVRLAIENAYDVGVIVSTDTDLLPALEAVESLRAAGGPRVLVVGFDGMKKRLRYTDARLPGLRCIVLTAQDYVNIFDAMVYVPRREKK